MGDLRITKQVITPVVARNYLDAHENYRGVSKKRAEAYARLMREGKWGLSILLFNEEGVLVDGQNRLEALCLSGTSQEFAVVAGWPQRDVVNIDNNQARTKGQVIKAELGIKNSVKAAAIAQGIQDTFLNSQYRTNMEVVDIVSKYSSIIYKVMEVQGSTGPGKAGVHAVAFCKAIIKYPERESDILESLRKMRELDFSEKRMSGLKSYYLSCIVGPNNQKVHASASTRRDTYLRCARAIEIYLNDEEVQRLQVPKLDPFLVN